MLASNEDIKVFRIYIEVCAETKDEAFDWVDGVVMRALENESTISNTFKVEILGEEND